MEKRRQWETVCIPVGVLQERLQVGLLVHHFGKDILREVLPLLGGEGRTRVHNRVQVSLEWGVFHWRVGPFAH